MKNRVETLSWVAVLLLISLLSACMGSKKTESRAPRTVRIAQQGPADVVGNDSAALQAAADMLGRGDTLEIGPGTYAMHNSLFVPSGVTVSGTPGQTILKKSDGVESRLVEDGDYGESQLRVAEPDKFRPGMGLAVSDNGLDSGWDISITTVQSVEGNLLRIGPMTLRDYNASQGEARVRNSFPILCAIETEDVVFENLIVDGNREANSYIDGCRGGAIYFYLSRNGTIRNCVARNYNGDGISFQITDNIRVIDCETYSHSGYGIHPGTGSDKPLVQNCRIHDNGQVGLFLCWRVRHGRFIKNEIQNNGRYGISIGHKDTDNEFADNLIAANGTHGVYFRKETPANSGHRNSFRNNQILNNGGPGGGCGVYIEPSAGDISFEGNRIAETRSDKERTQRIGIYTAPGAGSVNLGNNTIEGHIEKNLLP
jgi:parallel beta-helix repeat protein